MYYMFRYKFGEDGSLHILSAQVIDTGRYLCMATNQAGTERKRVDLQVYGECRNIMYLDNLFFFLFLKLKLFLKHYSQAKIKY